jgi:small-conductance mechanosensitive channel
MQEILATLRGFFTQDVLLFHIGSTNFTLGQLLAILLGMAALFIATGILNRVIVNRLLLYSHVELSTRYTVAALVRYTVLVVGVMVIMQTAGINLSAFSVLAGAVGVGVGFGLQNIVSNFISGLIVMFERPVKIGDRVELSGVQGNVIRIGARATQIVTSDGSVVFMPNQKFITDPVKNWAANAEYTPLVLSVSTDKAGNLRHAAAVLGNTVHAHPGVMDHPPARVWLTGISGNATFQILAWVKGDAAERTRIAHELYLRIAESLSADGIKLA